MSNQKPTYGAEDLSQKYPVFASVSLLVSLLLILGVFVYPFVRDALKKPSSEQIPVKVSRVINYSELSAPPPIDLERRLPEPLTAAPQAKVVKFLPPVVKKDEDVPDDERMPTRDEMSASQIGTANIEGVDSIFVERQEAVEILQPEPLPEEKLFNFVEIMPEFKGGKDGLYLYLAENMQYPTIARESEIQGTVYVAFVVETNGSITNVEVLRSVHPLLDEEAVRVIAAMPAWKPGKQNQSPVRVKFSLPIGFKLK